MSHVMLTRGVEGASFCPNSVVLPTADPCPITTAFVHAGPPLVRVMYLPTVSTRSKALDLSDMKISSALM